MKTAVLYKGEMYTVKALVTTQGKCYFKKFYDNLEKAEKAKTLALIKFFANRKRIANKEKFNYLGDKLWELKPTDQVRFPGFYHKEKVFIITHGFKKKERTTPPKQIRRAKNCRERFLGSKEG